MLNDDCLIMCYRIELEDCIHTEITRTSAKLTSSNSTSFSNSNVNCVDDCLQRFGFFATVKVFTGFSGSVFDAMVRLSIKMVLQGVLPQLAMIS